MNKRQGDQRTDRELEALLIEPRLWLIRGQQVQPAKNLQSAVVMAFERVRANLVVQAIVRMPADNIVILPDQIRRLWTLFRIVDWRGNVLNRPGPL